MAKLTYIPHQPSPWEQMQPTILNLLGQFGLQKMSQGFRAGQMKGEQIFQQKQAQAARDWERETLDRELASKERIAETKARISAAEKLFSAQADQKIKPGLKKGDPGPPAPDSFTGPFGDRWRPTSKAEKPTTLKGEKVYWKHDAEANSFVPTKVPVPKTEEKAGEKLKLLKGSYETYTKQYYAALKGTDIYTDILESEREAVTQDALHKSEEIAIQYRKEGGDPRDLGITAKGIIEDIKAGKIPEEKGIYLLDNLFPEGPPR